MDDKYSGANFVVTKIAVGPSAPPIIPIAEAVLAVKPVQPKPFLPKAIGGRADAEEDQAWVNAPLNSVI